MSLVESRAVKVNPIDDSTNLEARFGLLRGVVVQLRKEAGAIRVGDLGQLLGDLDSYIIRHWNKSGLLSRVRE